MKKTLEFITLLIIIALLVLTLTGCTSTETGSKTTLSSGEGSNSTSSASEDKKYNVGEIYEDSSIAIKYVSKDENFKGYSKYAEIKSGYKVIKAEFEFENVGSSDTYASDSDFTCYADGYDCEKFVSVDDWCFYANLSKGKKAKGAVYFEVPINASNIIIEYEANIFSSDKVVFVVK